jgi:predicted heme/steroid binding protein
MEPMLDAPEQHDAPAGRREPEAAPTGGRPPLRPAATRRALLLTALGGLLIAGIVTAVPIAGEAPSRLAGYGQSVPYTIGTRGDDTFDQATTGQCLMWPVGTPEAATIVDCKDDHRFEVAQSIDMRAFPGSEYGPEAAPPSAARVEQISQEQCEAAVHHYLGARFDPDSKFTISMMWSGDKAWRQAGERRVLCGLQLPGQDNQQLVFRGKVADIDQSKVWPDGTCLGIDKQNNQPTDVPVDCASPHAMEVTGTVNLAEKFPDALPPEQDQDAFIKDACTRMTDSYLAPVVLRNTTLTLIYSTLSLPSWKAGSHEVACSIGATLGNGGWAMLVNSAKGPLLINGQPPVPPPDIPLERLDLPPLPLSPPIPLPPAATNSTRGGNSSAGQTAPPPQTNQHLPRQGPGPLPPQPPPAAPGPDAPPAPDAPPPAFDDAPRGQPPGPAPGR